MTASKTDGRVFVMLIQLIEAEEGGSVMKKLFVIVLLMAAGCGQTPPGMPWVETSDASVYVPSHPVTNCVSPDDPDYQTLSNEWKNKLRCCVAADDPDYQVVPDEWKCPLANTSDSGIADAPVDSGEPQDAPPNLPQDAEAADGSALPDSGGDAKEISAEDAGTLQDGGVGEDSGSMEDSSALPDSGGDAICTCLCEYPGAQSDGGGAGGGHRMLHCHQGTYCTDASGCYNGYHCHVGHDCALVSDTTNHPECTNGEIIYVPHDTCGNPCECPAYNDLSYGGA